MSDSEQLAALRQTLLDNVFRYTDPSREWHDTTGSLHAYIEGDLDALLAAARVSGDQQTGLQEDVLRRAFTRYEGVWDKEPEVRILGHAGKAAKIIAGVYAELDREYPAALAAAKPTPEPAPGLDYIEPTGRASATNGETRIAPPQPALAALASPVAASCTCKLPFLEKPGEHAPYCPRYRAARVSGDPQTAGPGIKWWTLADVVHDRNESIAEIGGHCNHDESPPECIADAQRTAAEYNRRLAARVSGDQQTGLREAIEALPFRRMTGAGLDKGGTTGDLMWDWDEWEDVVSKAEVLNLFVAAIPADPADWTALANDIRIVDGNHDLGAGELAERLVERGWRKAAGDPAGLDVERLAQAIHDQTCREMGFGNGYFDSDHIGSSTCQERAVAIRDALALSGPSDRLDVLHDFLDEVKTLCEDNGQNAILVEDMEALINERRRAALAPRDPA